MSVEKNNFNEEKLYYSLTYEDTIQILNLIDNYEYRKLNIEVGDLKLKVRKEALDNGKTSEEVKEDILHPSDNTEHGSRVVSKNQEEEVLNDDIEDLEDKVETNSEKNNTQADNLVTVEASITGVFYKSPSPGEEPYVEVGSQVKKGDELGLVEVMKLFNTINAPCDGVVKEILVEDESVVNVDDVLITIEPT